MSESTERIAVLAPMPSELRPVVRVLSLRRTREGDGTRLTGRLGRAQIVACTTGVGTRAAEHTTEAVLRSGWIRHLIVVGVAGGIGASVAVGDLVVPEVVIDLASGAAYRPRAMGHFVPGGRLATSNRLISDPAEAAVLERQGFIAVDMETAAVAAVCERQGCPWSVFRAISDRADDGSTDPAIFGLAGPDGRPRLAAVARFVLTKPQHVPQLVMLARGLDLATAAAAAAVATALQETYAG